MTIDTIPPPIPPRRKKTNIHDNNKSNENSPVKAESNVKPKIPEKPPRLKYRQTPLGERKAKETADSPEYTGSKNQEDTSLLNSKPLLRQGTIKERSGDDIQRAKTAAAKEIADINNILTGKSTESLTVSERETLEMVTQRLLACLKVIEAPQSTDSDIHASINAIYDLEKQKVALAEKAEASITAMTNALSNLQSKNLDKAKLSEDLDKLTTSQLTDLSGKKASKNAVQIINSKLIKSYLIEQFIDTPTPPKGLFRESGAIKRSDNLKDTLSSKLLTAAKDKVSILQENAGNNLARFVKQQLRDKFSIQCHKVTQEQAASYTFKAQDFHDKAAHLSEEDRILFNDMTEVAYAAFNKALTSTQGKTKGNVWEPQALYTSLFQSVATEAPVINSPMDANPKDKDSVNSQASTIMQNYMLAWRDYKGQTKTSQ